MSYIQTGIDPIYLRAAADGSVQAQVAIASNLTVQAERIAAQNPQFAGELLAVAEFCGCMVQGREPTSPQPVGLLGYIFAIRSIMLEASDPVRALGYRNDAFAFLDAAAMSGNQEALGTAALGLTRLADNGDDEAAAKLNLVVAALDPVEAVTLREVLRADAEEVAALAAVKGE